MHNIYGRCVNVTIDRPMGSIHPRCPDIKYCVNYGYIEGIKAGDGAWQDVYVLGVARPLKSFTGRVIAVIKRYDDVEEKWVAVPEGVRLYEPEIRAQTHFVEQFFKTEYLCMYEKACGGILYTISGGVPRFLLIENSSGHIGYPKGHVEYSESERMTALREILEETGISASLIGDFRREHTVHRLDGSAKTYVHFLARFDGQHVCPQHGEVGHWWLAKYPQARELLNFDIEKEHLAAAYEKIMSL